MYELIIIAFFALLLFALFKGGKKIRTTPKSKLAFNEHPSTFKKPDIEMVNSSPAKAEDVPSTIYPKAEKSDRKDQ